jgi:hypothetical protein
VFPGNTFKIGSIPLYMGGLWAIPFFILLYYPPIILAKYNISKTYSILLISLILFGGSEMLLHHLGSWYAINVYKIYSIAIYIIPPEICLGYIINHMFHRMKSHSNLEYIVTSFSIMIVYLGLSVFSYFIVEKIIINNIII